MKNLLKEAKVADIEKNFSKIILSKNMKLISVLSNNLPSDKFEILFNNASYQEQRTLLDWDILNKLQGYGNNKNLRFKPTSFEEFKEVFEDLRLKKRLYHLEKNNEVQQKNYYDTKLIWECANLLKYIILPDLDVVINYLIEEAPLSFITDYQMSPKGSGSLPRTLTNKEFIRLLDKINSESPGLMYVGEDINNRTEIYRCMLEGHGPKDKNELELSDKNLDNYLKILDDLKSKPKDYAYIFSLTHPMIENIIVKLIDMKNVDENDYRSKKIYSWVNIPENCLILNEVKSIFDNKFKIIEKLNTVAFDYSLTRSEYLHKFFNIFIDKKVYLEGVKLIKEDLLLGEKIIQKNVKSFYSRFMSPYTYEMYDKDNETIYCTDYSNEELEKITKELINIDYSLFFDYNLPKSKKLLSEEQSHIALESPNSKKESQKDIYREAKENVFLKLIDENINKNNIWPIMLSMNYGTSYDRIDSEEQKNIFNEILNSPNLDLLTLKKLSTIIDLQVEFRNLSKSKTDLFYQDNEMLRNISENLISNFSATELRHIKINIESNIIEREVEVTINKKKVNVNKF